MQLVLGWGFLLTTLLQLVLSLRMSGTLSLLPLRLRAAYMKILTFTFYVHRRIV